MSSQVPSPEQMTKEDRAWLVKHAEEWAALDQNRSILRYEATLRALEAERELKLETATDRIAQLEAQLAAHSSSSVPCETVAVLCVCGHAEGEHGCYWPLNETREPHGGECEVGWEVDNLKTPDREYSPGCKCERFVAITETETTNDNNTDRTRGIGRAVARNSDATLDAAQSTSLVSTTKLLKDIRQSAWAILNRCDDEQRASAVAEYEIILDRTERFRGQSSLGEGTDTERLNWLEDHWVDVDRGKVTEYEWNLTGTTIREAIDHARSQHSTTVTDCERCQGDHAADACPKRNCDCTKFESCSDCDPEGHAYPRSKGPSSWLD